MLRPKIINLPCYGIQITLNVVDSEDSTKFIGGIISSKLVADADIPGLDDLTGNEIFDIEMSPASFIVAMHAIESFILAAACAGIDVESPAFIEAIETTCDKILNEYGD